MLIDRDGEPFRGVQFSSPAVRQRAARIIMLSRGDQVTAR